MKVKDGVTPRHGWGSARGAIGVVRSISGSSCTVNFPDQSGWSGVTEEMEVVPDDDDEEEEEGELEPSSVTITVSGCDSPNCNGEYEYCGERNGRACFNRTGSREGTLYFDGTHWKICQSGSSRGGGGVEKQPPGGRDDGG